MQLQVISLRSTPAPTHRYPQHLIAKQSTTIRARHSLISGAQIWPTSQAAHPVIFRIHNPPAGDCVAIDTLINVPHDKAAFRRAINEHFDELPNPPIWHKGSLDESRWREHWDKHVNRPVDAWVHDFCAARNAAAHGPADGEKGSIWPRHNHLIFSAWLLPLIVKKLLAQGGIYKLSAEDKVARAGFEVFLAHDLLAVTEEEGTNVWW
ncbi:hypothetical protein QMK56_10190 [Pseudomonas protegens]|nr:hypothetical protein [Pseudomonas protegens]